MDEKLRRLIRQREYKAYVENLRAKGIEFDILSDEELNKVPDTDLTAIIREMTVLARTPTQ